MPLQTSKAKMSKLPQLQIVTKTSDMEDNEDIENIDVNKRDYNYSESADFEESQDVTESYQTYNPPEKLNFKSAPSPSRTSFKSTLSKQPVPMDPDIAEQDTITLLFNELMALSKARAQKKIARQAASTINSAKEQIENYVEEWQGYMTNEFTKEAKSELSKLREIQTSASNLLSTMEDACIGFESENSKLQEEIAELSKRRKSFESSSNALLKEFEEEKSSLISGLKRKKTAAISQCKASIGEMAMSPGRPLAAGPTKIIQKSLPPAKRIRAI